MNTDSESSQVPNSVRARMRRRADGRYYQLLSFRGTEEQKALIDFAAEREHKSIQKLVEKVLMEWVETKYGQEFDNR